MAERLAAELAWQQPGSNDPIDEILASEDLVALVRAIAVVSLHHRTTLPVLLRLADAGIDLARVTLDPSALHDTQIPKLIPGVQSEPPEDLARLAAVLVEHQERLRSMLFVIGDVFPYGYMVGYGLGIDLMSVSESHRESSDIDLFAPSADEAHELAAWLIGELGFDARPVVERRYGRKDLGGRKLWLDQAGHHVGVDLFGPGRPSGGHSWIPPYRDSGLLPRARPAASPGPPLLVAAAEDSLAMLAEKTLRKGEFTHRRVHDAVAILTSPISVDGARLDEIARTHHVVAPLVWLLERLEARGAAVEHLLQHLQLARWERKMIDQMATAPVRRATRVRAIHRRIWVARYVRDSPEHAAALVEVLQGRFRKPRGERSR